MNLVNLTPHPIVLRDALGLDHAYPASGAVARVSSTPGALERVEGVPVPVAASTVYGAVEGLPAPAEGVGYIVSALVLARCGGRGDVFAPGTGPNDGAIRDDAGRIIAVTRLVRP
jgi:hypothetical protein